MLIFALASLLMQTYYCSIAFEITTSTKREQTEHEWSRTV